MKCRQGQDWRDEASQPYSSCIAAWAQRGREPEQEQEQEQAQEPEQGVKVSRLE
jgi:hypothetical protein